MRNIKLSEASENNESINISDPQMLESIAILAKILLSISLLESSEAKIINLNPTSEKIAA